MTWLQLEQGLEKDEDGPLECGMTRLRQGYGVQANDESGTPALLLDRCILSLPQSTDGRKFPFQVWRAAFDLIPDGESDHGFTAQRFRTRIG
jgi:hypothetical protein